MRQVRKVTETLKTDKNKIAPSQCAESPAGKDPRTLVVFARRRSLFSNDLASDGSYFDGWQKPPRFQTCYRPPDVV